MKKHLFLIFLILLFSTSCNANEKNIQRYSKISYLEYENSEMKLSETELNEFDKIFYDELVGKYNLTENKIASALERGKYELRHVEKKVIQDDDELYLNLYVIVWKSDDYFSVVKLYSPDIKFLNNNKSEDVDSSAWSTIVKDIHLESKDNSIEIGIGKSFNIKEADNKTNTKKYDFIIYMPFE